VEDIFHQYVRPTENPKLTPFCETLTGIRQEYVDSAKNLGQVMDDFQDWFNSKGLIQSKAIFLTNGDWDFATMLPSECKRKSIEIPPIMERWINIKISFGSFYPGLLPKGGVSMKGMLLSLGIELEGHHHSGLDDSKNISQILIKMLEGGCDFEATST
jgi:inhibitor of KinA sporulation pathway (predicted exonuclease)